MNDVAPEKLEDVARCNRIPVSLRPLLGSVHDMLTLVELTIVAVNPVGAAGGGVFGGTNPPDKYVWRLVIPVLLIWAVVKPGIEPVPLRTTELTDPAPTILGPKLVPVPYTPWHRAHHAA